MANDLKLKGPVREIGILRDHDRHDSFNITIGITIKTEGKITYEEAERLSTKFRREYLGKDVEFRAIHIPCPHCDKVLNSEVGLKQHILKIHPEKAELITPASLAAKVEKPGKKTQGKKAEKPTKRKSAGKRKTHVKSVKVEKPKAVATKKPLAAKKPTSKKTNPPPSVQTSKPKEPKVKTDPSKPTPILKETVKIPSTLKTPQKTKQLTLA